MTDGRTACFNPTTQIRMCSCKWENDSRAAKQFFYWLQLAKLKSAFSKLHIMYQKYNNNNSYNNNCCNYYLHFSLQKLMKHSGFIQNRSNFLLQLHQLGPSLTNQLSVSSPLCQNPHAMSQIPLLCWNTLLTTPPPHLPSSWVRPPEAERSRWSSDCLLQLRLLSWLQDVQLQHCGSLASRRLWLVDWRTRSMLLKNTEKHDSWGRFNKNNAHVLVQAIIYKTYCWFYIFMTWLGLCDRNMFLI